jgi:signal transduction histidine kinase/CheY-like chemotaxis protein
MMNKFPIAVKFSLSPKLIIFLFLLQGMQLALCQSSDNVEQIRDYISLSRNFIGVNNQRAKELANKALELARIAGIDSLKGKAHRFSGMASYFMSDFNQSLLHYDSALYYFIGLNDSIGQARIYNNKGALYAQLNLNQKAISEYIKARDIYQKVNNQRGIVIIYNNIGSLYQNLRDYNLAKSYYNMAIELAEKNGFYEELLNALSNIAMIYDLERQIPEAENAYRNALGKARQAGSPSINATLNLNFGTFWIEQKQADSALRYLLDAKVLYRDTNLNLAKLYLAIARAYQLKEQTDQAFNHYKLALENVEIGNDAVLRLNILKELAQLYARRGDFRNAYRLLADYTNETEYVRNENDSLKSSIIQLHFAISSHQIVNDTLKTHLAQAQHDIRALSSTKSSLVVFLSILLALCIVLGVFLIRSLKLNQRLRLINESNTNATDQLMGESAALLKHKQELANVNTLLRSVIDLSPNPLGIKGENNNWLIANEPMCRLMGVEPGLLNQCTSEDLAARSARSQAFLRMLEVAEEVAWMKGSFTRSNELLNDPEGINLGEYTVIRLPLSEANGARKFLIVYAFPINQITSTEAVNDSSNLMRALSLLSHEMRNPLNAVIGFSEMLTDDELESAKRHHYSRIIQRNGSVLLKLIDNLLTYSSLKAGEIALNSSEFDFRELFIGLHASLVDKALELGKHNLEVRLNIPEKPCMISGDIFRWQQLLENLTDNAIRFTQHGHIAIGFSVEEDGAKSRITAFVEDTGSGIPKELQNQVFQPFYRLAEHQNQGSGLGLGLSIVSHLAQLMNVKLDLSSKPGHGTCVSLHFNAKQPAKAKASPKVQSYEQGKLSGKKVLLVEDVESNTELLRIILEGAGAIVYHVVTGEEAIQLCHQIADLDLVLMDIQLPKMNGLEATKQIKTFRPDLLVVAHTAYAMANEKDACFEAGCDGYVAKPVKPRLMLAILEQLFEK